MADTSESEDEPEYLYDVLGLPKNCTDAEIRRRFRELALKYHPDKNPGNPEAERQFIRIKEAYEVLSNADKRKIYDGLSLEELLACLIEVESQLREARESEPPVEEKEAGGDIPWWLMVCAVLTCWCCCMCCCECCGKCKISDGNRDPHFNFSRGGESEPILRQPT